VGIQALVGSASIASGSAGIGSGAIASGAAGMVSKGEQEGRLALKVGELMLG
jgi:hypothetical protein